MFQFNVTVVEISPYVSYSIKYFGWTEEWANKNRMKERFQLQTLDATNFVMDYHCFGKKYEFIYLDAYDSSDRLPARLISSSGMKTLRQHCLVNASELDTSNNYSRNNNHIHQDLDGGWLIINIALNIPSYIPFINELRRQFPHVYSLESSKLNRIVVAQMNGPLVSRTDILHRTEQLPRLCPNLPKLTRGRGYFQVFPSISSSESEKSLTKAWETEFIRTKHDIAYPRLCGRRYAPCLRP